MNIDNEGVIGDEGRRPRMGLAREVNRQRNLLASLFPHVIEIIGERKKKNIDLEFN
jgi:hypothetical protein